MLGMRWASDSKELRQRLGIQLQETQLSEKLTVNREFGTAVSSFFPAGRKQPK